MAATRDKNEPRKQPVMPIRDMVIFPYMMTPFVVGRESSVRDLEITKDMVERRDLSLCLLEKAG